METTGRRVLLIAGLSVLIAMAVLSSYAIARSVHREMAVARLKSDFVAAVSHEFRTPLTSLRQFNELLREGGIDDERRRVCYEAQARATDRLTHLVESVLDFGAMEAGERRYQREAVNCGALARSVAEDVQRDVRDSGYTIACDIDDEGIDVLADEAALRRALRNLLENAVKYSPDPGAITVRVSRRGAHAAIAISDRGIGIPKDEQGVIFEQFRRGAEARARGIGGTGIGLAMVDQIARAAGGRVDVESEPGRGSTFTLLIPAAPPATAAEPSSLALRSSKLG